MILYNLKRTNPIDLCMSQIPFSVDNTASNLTAYHSSTVTDAKYANKYTKIYNNVDNTSYVKKPISTATLTA
jgi:hypothetical protein